MKRRELIKLLQKNGWVLTAGGKHDMVTNPVFPGTKIPIPRHIEINEWTAKGILQEAGIK